MNPLLGRYSGKSTAEPIMLKKAFGESPLLQELLPKATLQLASSLSNEDKEVLIYLIEYGRRMILAIDGPSSACKSPWKPWKLASKASRREQVASPCLSSHLCTKSSVLGEEVSLKRTARLLANHKAISTCDCFSCYSSFWSRWNVSASRDLINEILDVVEEGPKSSKGKKKKRADKKRASLGAEASAGKPGGLDENVCHASAQSKQASCLNVEGVMDLQTSNNVSSAPDSIDEVCVVMADSLDATTHASIPTDETLKITSKTLRAGRKKSMFRVAKQKEEMCAAEDSKVSKVSGATGVDDEALGASGLDGANGMDATDFPAASVCPALSSTKNTPRLHRITKRRQSQVIPLDYDGLSDAEREEEATVTMESTQVPISPRAADVGLGGRGFLARVFPDALGRVASRLWDLVSVRLRSSTVEYH